MIVSTSYHFCTKGCNMLNVLMLNKTLSLLHAQLCGDSSRLELVINDSQENRTCQVPCRVCCLSFLSFPSSLFSTHFKSFP